LFLISPVIAATDEEAHARLAASRALRTEGAGLETSLWFLDQMTTLDFGSFDPDMLMKDIAVEYEKAGGARKYGSFVDVLFKGQEERTLRQVASGFQLYDNNHGVVGSPDTVAAKLDEIMQEVGGDGFCFNLPTRRNTFAEVADGLAPILQRRGSIRSGYDGRTFKENLLAF
jgi:alkanesulfonate monooxygenase SsuD/methylene tetrahydromethanopterin reductase-like flavin-dependent oxidoreductase (luciferase family)